ncbi:MAG TPA: aspartyl protease family protein, partial [Pyrinomonadaceae bacterium]|nr:aspartyl protease family protein [Pyrinomonadaceae bacterium]
GVSAESPGGVIMVFPANHKYRRRTEGTSLTGGKGMGYVYADIELTSEKDLLSYQDRNLREDEIRKVTIRALVDSGAYDLVINQEIKEQLDLPVRGKRLIKLADETLLEVEIVGPVEVRFEDRATSVRALVLPGLEEVLLGAIPLEGLDVIIDPLRERLLVNPPDFTNSYIRQISLSA